MRKTNMMELNMMNIEAPLAKFETDEWIDFADYKTYGVSDKIKFSDIKTRSKYEKNCNINNFINNKELNINTEVEHSIDNFNETFSNSLEDLVNTFDEKISKCFVNYEEEVENFAPVQIRSQEEIMNECQMWWTITANFGNILPINWSKSSTRKLHLKALPLNCSNSKHKKNDELLDEDEVIAGDLDMHSIILNGVHHEEPVQTAEEVIKEIDDIIKATSEEEHICRLETRTTFTTHMLEEKLQTLSTIHLNELYMELEHLIQEFSEILITQLALRDELEYEKELKNQFISLLLSVQNKRRQYNTDKKKKNGMIMGMEPKFLTTVIPYHLDGECPDVEMLQILIKILKAIDEDSPAVPAMLTDYILKARKSMQTLPKFWEDFQSMYISIYSVESIQKIFSRFEKIFYWASSTN